ncbi:MAG: DUF4915 domain-containing protein [Cyanobium sp.]|jgi:hypothetical protein
MTSPAQPPPAPELKPVVVRYEHSQSLPALLERLRLSVLVSTYQAGRVVSVGSHQGELRLGFSRFDQAMGLTRTASGIAVGSRDAIWSLPASREIARRIKPEGEHDIAFLARSCHHSWPLMGHDLAWGNGRLWLVNTLFNGLVTIEGYWSFVPQWQPPFISGWAAGDRCHLNGLALAEDGSAPAYVTALGETDAENGWREHKGTGGCLIHVPSGEVVLRRLDCIAGRTFVVLSQSQETAVVGGLPLQDSQQELFCALALVDLAIDAWRELLWFHRVLEELFTGCKRLPAHYQKVCRTGIYSEHDQPSCLGPPVATG